MPKSVVESRVNDLKLFLDNLGRDERDEIKNSIREELEIVALDVYQRLRAATPQREPDSSDIFGHRQDAWAKYGVQNYIVSQSPYPSERQHGMTLRSGWTFPEFDFIGSTKDFINVNVSFGNMAPHARLALLGEYNKSSWEIPGSGGLHGGRRAMMWMASNGRPVFRWVHTVTRTSPNVGPVTFNAPSGNLSYLLARAEQELEISGQRMINRVANAIRRSFDGL